MGCIIWGIMLRIDDMGRSGSGLVMRMLSTPPAPHLTLLMCRITSVEEVLSEGARGVFMLMYELISPEPTTTQEQRELSLAPTLDTVETTPEHLDTNPENLDPSTASSPTISDDVPAVTDPTSLQLQLQLQKVHISPPS